MRKKLLSSEYFCRMISVVCHCECTANMNTHGIKIRKKRLEEEAEKKCAEEAAAAEAE